MITLTREMVLELAEEKKEIILCLPFTMEDLASHTITVTHDWEDMDRTVRKPFLIGPLAAQEEDLKEQIIRTLEAESDIFKGTITKLTIRRCL